MCAIVYHHKAFLKDIKSNPLFSQYHRRAHYGVLIVFIFSGDDHCKLVYQENVLEKFKSCTMRTRLILAKEEQVDDFHSLKCKLLKQKNCVELTLRTLV